RLRYAARNKDTVARAGSDEFAVLLEDSDRALVDRTIADIRSQFSDPFVVEGESIEISCSIGIADTVVCGADFDALFRGASSAAVEAKSRGGGSFQMYEAQLHSIALDRLGLAGDLRGILHRDELFLEF